MTTELEKNKSYEWDEMVLETKNKKYRGESLEVNERKLEKSLVPCVHKREVSSFLEELNEIIGSMKEAVSI